MKKKNEKKEKNKEELKKYLKELSTKESLSEDDADRLSNMIETLVLGSKTERILAGLATFVFKFIILFIVSLVASAFFLDQFLLDRYYIFLIAGAIAFLLTISEMSMGLFKNNALKAFVISVIAIVLISVTFNFIVPVFTFGSVWIIYLILIEVIYNLLMYTLFKRKLRS